MLKSHVKTIGKISFLSLIVIYTGLAHQSRSQNIVIKSFIANTLFYYNTLLSHSAIQIVRQPDVAYMISSIPEKAWNFVLESHFNTQISDTQIEAIKDIFTHNRAPLTWWIMPDSTPDNLGERLRAHNFVIAEEYPILFYDLQQLKLPPQNKSPLLIKRVSNEQEVRDFCLMQQFEPDQAPIGFELYAKFLTNQYPIELYVGYVNGKPVTGGVITYLNGIGSIHGFVTIPQEQKKGHGTQLLHALLQRLNIIGCSLAVLDSSQEGKKLYINNGFIESGTFTRAYILNNA